MAEPFISNAMFEPRADLDRLQRRALSLGVAGVVATAAGYFLNGGGIEFYRAYLVGWLWSVGIAVGMFALSMLHHISGGDWGIVMRRIFEASGRTLPFFLLAGLPLIPGLAQLYPWVAPEVGADGRYVDALLEHKRAYLNVSGFLTRSVIYFVGWTIMAFILSSWSHKHDETGDDSYREKMKRLSCFGLIFYVLAATLASVDWVMSLDPHWFSSLFGFAMVAGHFLSAFAFVVPIMLFLSHRKPMSEVIRTKVFHDYGKFMLAGIMVWAYFMISQYLIIWSGNLPEEIAWYIVRKSNGWQTLSLILIVAHFAVPFLLLLSADLKKRPKRLMWVSIWVLVMRWLDLYWQTAPSLTEAAAFHWLNLVVPIGLGGLWTALLIGQFKNRALVPVRDPRLEEVLAHG